MIQILKDDVQNKSTTFLMKNIPICVINSLRRIIISDIKNSGIHPDNISIFKNGSVLNNELIAQNISLVPIKTKTKKCSLQLNVINIDDKPKYVTSSDIKVVKGDARIYKDIILCILKKGEELQFTAETNISTGTIYRPTGNCYFRKLKTLYVRNGSNSETKIRNYLKNCEFNLYENIKKEYKGYKCIGISDNFRDMNLDNLTSYLEINKGDFIYSEENEYAFFIEESFFIKPKKILQIAIKILISQIEKFLKCEYSYKIKKNTNDIFQIEMKINNISCTVLNPFVYYMKQNKNILFAHYDKTHPFNDYINLHITIKQQHIENYTTIKQVVTETFKNMKKELLMYHRQ